MQNNVHSEMNFNVTIYFIFETGYLKGHIPLLLSDSWLCPRMFMFLIK